MKKIKVSNTRVPHFLYTLDVHVFATGTIRSGISGKALYDYYKADGLTKEQRERIVDSIPDVEFHVIGSMYAPEQRRTAICVPKQALRRSKQTALHV